jgi:hypothetical protein
MLVMWIVRVARWDKQKAPFSMKSALSLDVSKKIQEQFGNELFRVILLRISLRIRIETTL